MAASVMPAAVFLGRRPLRPASCRHPVWTASRLLLWSWVLSPALRPRSFVMAPSQSPGGAALLQNVLHILCLLYVWKRRAENNLLAFLFLGSQGLDP